MILLLIGAVALTACSGLTSSSLNNPNMPGPLTLEQAEETAGSFLSAWQSSDFAAMYALISPDSQSRYSEQAFTDAYTNAATQMTLNSLESSIHEAARQGTTAIIRYDVTFQSEMLGPIADPNRIMRLIETPDGWRVAWSFMDILSELTEGARLELQRVLPPRGNIYDRDGDVLVDDRGTAVQLYLIQQNIPNPDGCMNALSRILRRELDDLRAQFGNYFPESRFLVGEIDEETYQREQQFLSELCRVEITSRTTRLYAGELATHLIGYVAPIPAEQQDEYKAYPVDALIGREGIERAYQQELAGTIGGALRILAPTGETLRELAAMPAVPGQDVYLTIDRELQAAVQLALVQAYNLSGPTWSPTSRGAAAVVMDVKTGEVLAMASYPWFNPSLFNPNSPLDRGAMLSALESDPRTPLLNRPLQGLYPAASVFKIVSMAAGLDSGVYDLDTMVVCDGTWEGEEYGDQTRTDWEPEGHGDVDFPKALTYSCNPYFWQLGVELHRANPGYITQYAREMGLGIATGQSLLPENIGAIPGPDNSFGPWALSSTLNLVIGQGDVQITPMQIVRMTAAVASNGKLWEPRFVLRVQGADGVPTYQSEPGATDLGYTPTTYEAIRAAMCDVTLDENGTARFIFEEWYNYQATDIIVCGKTGTAQAGGETVKPHSWFTAFVPQDDPQIAITVLVENSCEGSEVAAPIVRRIIEDYYHMPQSEWPPLWQDECSTIGE
ncbi:MAG: hypothetical protein GXY36_14890 [Chloroflexi bacterium]|nr:hypothetical protein [Chloroflexota bacterium]